MDQQLPYFYMDDFSRHLRVGHLSSRVINFEWYTTRNPKYTIVRICDGKKTGSQAPVWSSIADDFQNLTDDFQNFTDDFQNFMDDFEEFRR